MHHFITRTFSAIITLVHLVIIIGGIGFLIIALAEGMTAHRFFMGVGAIFGYVLFAGTISVLLRINENLERIANASEKGGALTKSDKKSLTSMRKEPTL